jgi:hypothetical protein
MTATRSPLRPAARADAHPDTNQLRLIEGEPPVTLGGEFILPNVPNGMPVNGHAATLTLPRNRRWSMPIWSGE